MRFYNKAFLRITVCFLLFAMFFNHISDNTIIANAESAAENAADSGFSWPVGPSVNADAAIVMEVTTGLILYEKDIYTAYYPASITKVMTALLALENCSLNEVVTMSDAAEKNVYGSRIGLVSGEQVLLRDAMYGMLLESANEVSYAIGEHVAAKVNSTSGSNEEFAALMNARAESLGCVNSHFTNPHGLHEDGHYTCAYDMALIGKAAIAFPDFRKIAGTRTYTIPATNKNVARPVANHHRFIRKTLTYSPAIAGKTGGTNEALTTLITFAEKDGLTLVAVVMHVDTALHAYEDTIKILDFAFDNYSVYNIENTELELDVRFPSLFSQTEAFASGLDTLIHIGKNSNVVLPNSANFAEATKTISYHPVEEFVHGDNVIGNISYQFGGKYIGYADIIYYNPDYPVTRAEFEALWPSYMIPPSIVFQDGTGNTGSSGSNHDSADTPGSEEKDKSEKWYHSTIFRICVLIILLLAVCYLVFVEIPYRKRRRAYKRRRKSRS